MPVIPRSVCRRTKRKFRTPAFAREVSSLVIFILVDAFVIPARCFPYTYRWISACAGMTALHYVKPQRNAHNSSMPMNLKRIHINFVSRREHILKISSHNQKSVLARSDPCLLENRDLLRTLSVIAETGEIRGVSINSRRKLADNVDIRSPAGRTALSNPGNSIAAKHAFSRIPIMAGPACALSWRAPPSLAVSAAGAGVLNSLPGRVFNHLKFLLTYLKAIHHDPVIRRAPVMISPS